MIVAISIALAVKVDLNINYITYYLCAYIFLSGISFSFIKILKTNIQAMLTLPCSITKIIKLKAAAYLLIKLVTIIVITILIVLFYCSKFSFTVELVINLLQYLLFLISLWNWGLLIATLTLLNGKNSIIIELCKCIFFLAIFKFSNTSYVYGGYSLLTLATILLNKIAFKKLNNESLLMKGLLS
ncbi:hypothetical protein IMX26_07405 [Clostridium sp. 'deep sea']|uniref:hypothetical protein n=1 Tax=Clostridium sp. 'deep sea' TaxID=2779445 RepID=UPI0018964897|nr:hypothetical protein [Clostridium sp. 'deep sea']QOR36624.1 hypothetical protein IMX26_07405 [Clostridium sp. 'deep sea']